MNWIDISKQRPDVEPHRCVLVAFDVPDSYGVFLTTDVRGWPKSITHWAEIEPPKEGK